MGAELMREYARAATKFKQSETDLAVDLDSLAAARDAGDPSAVAQAYRRAQRSELACTRAFDVHEQARRAAWQARATQAEVELERAVLPLLAALRFCHRAGGAVVADPVGHFLSRLGCMTLPATAGGLVDGMPPISAAASDVLERAEDANLVLLRGGAALQA